MAYNATLETIDAYACTPSDSAIQSGFGFYVGTTGSVSVVTAAGTTVVFTAVPAGAIIPLNIQKINLTGTSATNIVIFGPK
jgi:hypothetical protein